MSREGSHSYGTASFGGQGVYRYRLTRAWDETRPRLAWIMLNPSAATASRDDPTIRRVVGFSRCWGFGSVEVVNLFALRATRPKELIESPFPVGHENDRVICRVVSVADDVMAAWGNHGTIPNPATGTPRSEEVLDLLATRSAPIRCLALTEKGQPRHPLYMGSDTKPMDLSGSRLTARQKLVASRPGFL